MRANVGISKSQAFYDRATDPLALNLLAQGFTPEYVDTALSSFIMRREGASLTPAERRAVAEFVTGRPAGSYRTPLEVIPKSAYCTGSSASS